MNDVDELVTTSGIGVDEGWTFLSGIDESASYEVDMTEIWRNAEGKFGLATASGCSCRWSGEHDVETFDTLDDLAASLLGTEREYGNPSAATSKALVDAARAAL